MQRKVILTIIFIIIIFIIILVFGKISSSISYKKEVEELFSKSDYISDKVFDYEQISDLPDPVHRYFKHVLREGQPYISYIRLKHDGQFKTDLEKDWMDIEGEQYFTTEKPGFIWIGKTKLFTARDMFLSGKGGINVKLFSLLKVVNGEGEAYDQGELLRWLGESVWFPTNLLPNDNLSWSPIDSNSAKLTFNYNEFSISYIVLFNEKNEIVQLETKRYMGEEGLKTWIGRVSSYKEINGMIIPTKIEAIWKLDSVEHSYAKFKVKEIEYNVTEKY